MVVCGWTVDYFIQSVTGSLKGVNDFSANFSSLLANRPKQVGWMFFFVILTAYFIFAGVQKGIERSAKILMPLLFLLLVILVVRSISLSGAGAGIDFLFKPDFQEVKSTVFLDAMGQSFFSLSLGMGCMLTYASYFTENSNLTATAVKVSLLDTAVALLAGLVIFPSAFALTANPDTIVSDLVKGGPGLLYITVPELFNQMPGSMIWSAMFFLLLTIAALTSTISLMEVVTIYIQEEHRVSRKEGLLLVVLGVLILGTVSALSPSFFNGLDMISAKIMLPVGGLFISLFAGWYLDKRIIQLQLTNNGKIRFGVNFLKVYSFILRYLAPVAILLIFLYGLIGQ